MWRGDKMRLTEKKRNWSADRDFKGQKKKYEVTISLSAREKPYWYYKLNKKDEKYSYNCLWENLKYNTQEECVSACEAKIDELVKQQKKNYV